MGLMRINLYRSTVMKPLQRISWKLKPLAGFREIDADVTMVWIIGQE
jgi:hypothetical protein